MTRPILFAEDDVGPPEVVQLLLTHARFGDCGRKRSRAELLVRTFDQATPIPFCSGDALAQRFVKGPFES